MISAGIAVSDVSNWHVPRSSGFNANSEDCSSGASSLFASKVAIATFTQLVDGVIGEVDFSDSRYLKLPRL